MRCRGGCCGAAAGERSENSNGELGKENGEMLCFLFCILHSAFCISRGHAVTERLVRAVGFWGLVAMCINAVGGSGVFLLPTESYKLLGPFSLWAPLLFAVPVFI